MEDLNEAYKQMLVDIQELIKIGHHPNDIRKDDPKLVEDIDDKIHIFFELCEKQ